MVAVDGVVILAGAEVQALRRVHVHELDQAVAVVILAGAEVPPLLTTSAGWAFSIPL
jgi:hypothetical protein